MPPDVDRAPFGDEAGTVENSRVRAESDVTADHCVRGDVGGLVDFGCLAEVLKYHLDRLRAKPTTNAPSAAEPTPPQNTVSFGAGRAC